MLIGTCMTIGCDNPCAPALKRGLCMKCYSKAKKLVDSGKTTWQKLADIEMCLPEIEDDLFTKEFLKRTGDADSKQTTTT